MYSGYPFSHSSFYYWLFRLAPNSLSASVYAFMPTIFVHAVYSQPTLFLLAALLSILKGYKFKYNILKLGFVLHFIPVLLIEVAIDIYSWVNDDGKAERFNVSSNELLSKSY